MLVKLNPGVNFFNIQHNTRLYSDLTGTQRRAYCVKVENKLWLCLLVKLSVMLLVKLIAPNSMHLFICATKCFFEVCFFGSFGQLAVQAAQIWAVFGRQTW